MQRDRTDPSIHEGLSGKRSAGFKENVNPYIGQLPASYVPFRGIGRAIGSLVAPFSVPAPSPSDPSSYGYKPTVQFISRFFPGFKNEEGRLFTGAKGIGGVNVTDVAELGTPGGRNPGDPYWVAFPRPGNVENPPFAQTVHHPWDCYCRWDEIITCPVQSHPNWHVATGAPDLPQHFIPISCQACFGVDRIRKHDFYVGTSKSGVIVRGYPGSYPADPGYQECLKQSVDSFATSGPGGFAPGAPELYGL